MQAMSIYTVVILHSTVDGLIAAPVICRYHAFDVRFIDISIILVVGYRRLIWKICDISYVAKHDLRHSFLFDFIVFDS